MLAASLQHDDDVVAAVVDGLSSAASGVEGRSLLAVELEFRRLVARYLLGLGGLSLGGGGPWARNSRLSCLE